MTECIDIDKIIVGERDRQEFGDIVGLAESIDDLGLLHPVVVTADHQLVAGGRRLEACKQLGWQEVPVTVVDLANAEEVLQAESDENTCRKGLTPYEASRARERRAKILAPVAAQNVGGRPPKAAVETSSNLDEVSKTPPTDKATRKVAAKGTGYSGSTLDKVDKIRDTAERGVIRQGKTEIPAPAPVVEVAKKSLEAVKQTGVAVDRASRDYQAAVDDFITVVAGCVIPCSPEWRYPPFTHRKRAESRRFSERHWTPQRL